MYPENQQPSSTRSPLMKAISAILAFWLVSWVLIPVGIVLILHNFVFSAYNVVGSSMVPTMQDKDYLIVSKVEKSINRVSGRDYIPNRGEIVVFHYPKQPQLDFVKRIAAVPNDRITVKNCEVRVYTSEIPNGFNPDEEHEIAGSCTEGEIDIVIPEGNVFVIGDNRLPGGSSDSREWGLLPSDDIVGNVKLRLYPFNQISAF